MRRILNEGHRHIILTTRFITLISGFVLNLVIANIILSNAGTKEYAIYSFIASLPALLNFLDFGMGTAAYNELVDSKNKMSKYDRNNQTLSLIFLSSFLMTFLSVVFYFVALKVAPSLFQISLLSANRLPELLSFAIILVCITIPFSVSYKVLQATDRNLDVILLQGIIPLVALLIVYMGIQFSTPIFIYISVPISLLLISILAFLRTYHFFEIAILPKFSRDRLKLYDLIRHSYLSLVFILLANLFIFLPRYVLAQKGSADAMLHLGFMLMFFISAQSLVSVDAQASVTRIRRSSKVEQPQLIRIGTARSIMISIVISLCLIALSFIDNFLEIRILTLQEALFCSTLLIIWAVQLVSASANSQTKNIPFFISLYFAILLLSILINNFFQVTTFSEVFMLLMAPCYLLITLAVIAKFRFKVNA